MEGGTAPAQRLAASLGPWPSKMAPHIVCLEPDEAEQAAEKGAAGPTAAWVICPQGHQEQGADAKAELYHVLDLLSGSGLPVMLSRADESLEPGSTFIEGVLVEPLDGGPDRLRAGLLALLSQARTMQNMRSELAASSSQQGAALRQIEEMDFEMRLAARVQREFIPRAMPDLPMLSFAALYRPAGYVSGDLYDVMRLDEDHVGFYVADVIGHGVPAAMMTMFIKQALPTRQIVAGHGYRLVPPHEALSHLNQQMLTHKTDTLRFATACYAILNHRTLELELASAGHPNPLLMSGDGSIRALEAHGPLLGVFGDAEFTPLRVQLAAGDRLLLYSDGFEIAFGLQTNGAPLKGTRRADDANQEPEYIRHLLLTRRGTVEQAIEHLEQELDEQLGSLHPQDDLTAVLIDLHATSPATRKMTEAISIH